MAEAGLHITGVAGAATLGKHKEPAFFDAKGELLPAFLTSTVAWSHTSRIREGKRKLEIMVRVYYVYVPYLSTAQVMEGIVGIRGPQEKQ